jgi:hypothetical protein
VLKLASLLLDLRFAVQRKAVGEEPLSKAVPPDDIPGALTSPVSQSYDQAAVAYRDARGLESIVTRIHERLVIVPLGRMRGSRDQTHFSHPLYRQAHRQRPMDFHTLNLSRLSVLCENPKFFEHLVELLLVSHGEDLLGSDLAVVQFDSTIA